MSVVCKSLPTSVTVTHRYDCSKILNCLDMASYTKCLEAAFFDFHLPNSNETFFRNSTVLYFDILNEYFGLFNHQDYRCIFDQNTKQQSFSESFI